MTSVSRVGLNFRNIACVLTTALLAACNSDPSTTTLSVGVRINPSHTSVVSYDTTWANLTLLGNVQGSGLTPGAKLEFHSDAACSTSPLGSDSVARYSSGGIAVRVPSTGSFSIYANVTLESGGKSSCQFQAPFQLVRLTPDPPSYISADPVTPSRTSSTPLIRGSSTRNSGQVILYDDVACTHSVGAGSALDFTNVGLAATLVPNLSNLVYARAIEPFGNASACVLLVTYVHDSTPPGAPSLSATLPISPSNSSTTPLILGVISAAATDVTLYSDAACTNSLATGTRAQFASPGLTIRVTANSQTSIYGRAVDAVGNLSTCAYLAAYVHDGIAPAAPAFASAFPASPSGTTLYPKIIGTAPTDALSVNLFSDALCTVMIGSGRRSDFVSIGISARVSANATTSIFAQAVDGAANSSTCTALTDYSNDSIAPDLPILSNVVPASPNNLSTTPTLSGVASSDTTTLIFYSDATCTSSLGSGTAAQFSSPGITLSVPANTQTSIYGVALDAVGNRTDCTYFTDYSHSTVLAQSPVLVSTSPSTPSNVSTTPRILGSAATNIVTVWLYSDACSTVLAQSNRSTFVSSGIRITATPNAITPVYAMVQNSFGNYSVCVHLVDYVHDNTAPAVPVFTASTPASPNNASFTPKIQGTAPADAALITLYDSSGCSNALGSGTRANFMGAGITAGLSPNTVTNIYAKTSDAAGNTSACTSMLTYAHDTLPPTKPVFLGATPGSPSYSRATSIRGSSSSDTVTVALFSDAGCALPLGGGSKGLYDTVGLPITAPANTTTGVYAQSLDLVGNPSACKLLTNFTHSDTGPANLQAYLTATGAVALSWDPDFNASTYVIKRSLRSGGPYTILAPAYGSSSFTDQQVSNSNLYYYVVAAANATGQSLDSSEVSQLVSVTAPSAPTSLTASPGNSEVKLTWFGSVPSMTYSIYRSTRHDGPYTRIIKDLGSSLYTDSTVTNSTSYYYVVTGSNPSGESAFSSEASVTPLSLPLAPTGLSAVSGPSGVILVWSAPSRWAGFKIKRATQTGGPYTVLGTPGTTSYTDTSPSGGGSPLNYYVVSATWGSQESADSAEVTFANTAGPTLSANAGDNHVLLQWGSTGAVDYRLLRSTSAGGPYSILASNAAGPTYVDSTAINGTTYYYVVSSNLGAGLASLISGEVSARPASAPAAPANLVVTLAGAIPNLTWSTSRYANFYNIQRAAVSGGPYTLLGSTTGNAFTDVAPLAGKNYYVATAAWGQNQTSASNEVVFRNTAAPAVALALSGGNIQLTWTAVTGAANYKILRSTTTGGPYTTVISNAAGTSYINTGLTAATGYFYVLTANFADGTQSLRSTEVGLGTSGTVPRGLQVTSNTGTTVGLTWARVSGATSYTVKNSTVSGGPYTVVTSGITLPKATLTGLTGGTTLYFVVSSVVSGVPSANSAEVATAVFFPPPAPNLIAGLGQVTINWSPSAGSSSSNLQRSTDGTNFTLLAGALAGSSYTDSSVTNGALYFYRVQSVFPGPFVGLFSASSAGISPGIIPLAPSGLTLSGVTSSTASITWSSIPGATTYTLMQSGSSGGPYTPVPSATNIGSNSVSLTGLSPATPLYFVVRSLIGSVESSDSPELGLFPIDPPPAPIANSSAVGVQVSWSAVAGATSYEVQRSQDAVNFTSLATGIAGTSYLDASAPAGVPLFYLYRPTLSGILSTASVMSLQVTSGIAPTAPQGLVAQTSGSGTAALRWVPSANSVNYRIYRSNVSGGPYSLVSSTSSTSQNDTGLLNSQSYFYVVTALNSSSVESSYSTEAGLSLNGTISDLAATSSNGRVQLSWSLVAGASNYRVRRSLQPGGPFGEIASAVATGTYTDLAVSDGVAYHYVVTAGFASGGSSADSNEATTVATARMNLEVPIELTDTALASLTATTTFERTRTSLDPGAYDGTVTYSFEVVALNADTSPRQVNWIASDGTVASTLNIPAGTFVPTRFTAGAVPKVGADTYLVKLDGSTTASELQVFSARARVRQIGASRTRLYIPLLSSGSSPSGLDAGQPAFQGNFTTYTQLPTASIYRKDTSTQSTLADFNAWEFEALVAAQGGAAGSIVLYNTTRSQIVEDTESVFSGAGIQMVSAPFDEGVFNFGAANESDLFETSIRCNTGCAAGNVSVYKAGLWLTLHDLNQAEVVYRVAPSALGVTSAGDLTLERTVIDLSRFSNGAALLQTVSRTPSPSPVSVTLETAASSDSSGSGFTLISGGQVDTTSATKIWQRSAGLSLPANDRFVIHVDPNGGTLDLSDAGIVIQSVR